MRILKGLAASLLWILAGVLGLVSLLLCLTVILLPLGIPLLGLARRMFTRAVALMLPRAMSHPLDEGRKKARSKKDELGGTAKKGPKKAKKVGNKGPEEGVEAGSLSRASPKGGDRLPQPGVEVAGVPPEVALRLGGRPVVGRQRRSHRLGREVRR